MAELRAEVTVTLAELRADVTARLGSSQEAAWVLEDVLGGEARRWRGDRPVEEAARRTVEELVARRRAGEPLQYVLGHWSFRRLELAVDRRALIPRPETEQLVELALGELAQTLGDRRDPRLVDLGTGSGAVALSLADELVDRRPEVAVWAVDDDSSALALARHNVGETGRSRPRLRGVVQVRGGWWWRGLPPGVRGRVDLVVSNPPYVARDEWDGLDPEVRDHEPRHALVAEDGPDGAPGMAALAAVIVGAPRWLARPGQVVVELAPAQAGATRALAERAGFDTAEVRPDLTGRPRFVVARLEGPPSGAGAGAGGDGGAATAPGGAGGAGRARRV